MCDAFFVDCVLMRTCASLTACVATTLRGGALATQAGHGEGVLKPTPGVHGSCFASGGLPVALHTVRRTPPRHTAPPSSPPTAHGLRSAGRLLMVPLAHHPVGPPMFGAGDRDGALAVEGGWLALLCCAALVPQAMERSSASFIPHLT